MKKQHFQSILGAIALICMLSLPLSSVSLAQGSVGGGGDPSLCYWNPDQAKCMEEYNPAGYCATYPPNCDGPVINP
ncbi:hypothetical protein [Algoriphagus faecimaris]|uniref:hypothetical protein n=1 Tax=Algoriphagus faecimaris TaxID=686796 RepID=UPI000B453B7D|nr:hypothetical protein [Algoriphagus faecimaris]